MCKLSLVFSVALPALTGLVRAAQGQDERTDRVIQPLTAGKVVSVQQQQDLGLISVQTGFAGQSGWVGCSGIFLSNNWAMTAGHCLDVIEGKTTNVTTAFAPGAFRADAVYKFGVSAGDSAGPDIGLVHIATPIPINSNTTGFVTRFWTGVVVGKSVSVFGASTGSYLASEMAATATPGRNILVSAGPNGETTAQGDSGGPGIIWDNDTPFLIGIVSTSGPPATLASIPAHLLWIVAVTKSQWFPDRSTNSIEVELDEINATLWSFAPYASQLDRVPWAVASRAATTLCMNRGMAGGHFEGKQNESRVLLQCSKRTNVVWEDVLQSNINNTDWSFSDINAVPWAQANRAAERLCALKNQGFAGGHFTGHMASGWYGLFCYRDGAQWFDANGADIAATGFGFPTYKLDDVSWAQAARAATGYCRSRGFLGGFMNGHQIPGKFGVVCQK